ncbi:hypothetical protein BDR06DRAFT_1004815 [Suillus hirtellus]|nr:hypothetical protein BDR06DRAFT_1004815 [Suillus hirtellus]
MSLPDYTASTPTSPLSHPPTLYRFATCLQAYPLPFAEITRVQPTMISHFGNIDNNSTAPPLGIHPRTKEHGASFPGFEGLDSIPAQSEMNEWHLGSLKLRKAHSPSKDLHDARLRENTAFTILHTLPPHAERPSQRRRTQTQIQVSSTTLTTTHRSPRKEHNVLLTHHPSIQIVFHSIVRYDTHRVIVPTDGNELAPLKQVLQRNIHDDTTDSGKMRDVRLPKGSLTWQKFLLIAERLSSYASTFHTDILRIYASGSLRVSLSPHALPFTPYPLHVSERQTRSDSEIMLTAPPLCALHRFHKATVPATATASRHVVMIRAMREMKHLGALDGDGDTDLQCHIDDHTNGNGNVQEGYPRTESFS